MKLALVFKCASDAIFLDDFKSVLDKIAESALKRHANPTYDSQGNLQVSRTSGRHQRGSSTKYRPGHKSHQPSISHQPQHIAHITAENSSKGRAKNSGKATEQQPRFAPLHGIRAETTIIVSEDKAARRTGRLKLSNSRERIFKPWGSLYGSSPPTHDWGHPPLEERSTKSSESAIAMLPMPSKAHLGSGV